MSEFAPIKTGRGSLLQNGVPKRARLREGLIASNGLMVRGVVTATYVQDDAHPHYQGSKPQLAVYCDVLCYTGNANTRYRFLRQVPVSQDVGGMQRGRIWKPRATTIDITTVPLDTSVGGTGSNIANWDGDHVLIGFMGNSLNQPVILRGMPHPAVDTGNTGKDIGHRLTLKKADGDPDFLKHHGTFFGIKDAGDFIIDTTFANDGNLLPDGTEAPNAMDGSGAHLHQLPETATWKVKLVDIGGTIPSVEMTVSKTELKHVIMDTLGDLLLQIGGGATLKVEGQDSQAKLTLGDGAKHVAIGEQLQTWWGTVKAVLDAFGAHTHTGVTPGPGLTGTPVAPLITPGYAATNTSTKVAIPDL